MLAILSTLDIAVILPTFIANTKLLPNAADFREIISGRRHGIWPGMLRGALSLAEPAYAAVMRHRNRRYEDGRAATLRVPAPVISVGNITTGGTGKTPFVAWLAQWFAQRDRRVAIVSRGYGARGGMPNDEAMELATLLPAIPHLQNPDRVAAAQQAIEKFCEIILLDDAFQHRRLHRDLDIVLIDALEPFGFDHLLPRGLLREPLTALQRAHVLVLSRADLVQHSEREEILSRLRERAPNCLIVESVHRPQRLFFWGGETNQVSTLREQRVAAFCGIGNPHGFQKTLSGCGAEIAGFQAFSDHYAYQSRDVERLTEWAAQLGVSQVVCTMKDLVKIGRQSLGECPLSALTIGVEFATGIEKFVALLETIALRIAPRNSAARAS